MQQEEILNIKYHVKRLVLKALNKFQNNEAAADALEITSRTLIAYKHEFNIKKRNGKYFIQETKR